jgi:hypothetical protein
LQSHDEEYRKMTKAVSWVTRGGLALACAGFIACGAHEMDGSDAGFGGGGSAGSSATSDGSAVDRGSLDMQPRPETDANGGRGGTGANDAPSVPDAGAARDGAPPVDAALQDRSVTDTALPEASLPDVSIPDVSLPDVSIPDVSDASGCTLDYCRKLPHVMPNAPVECRFGQCYIPPTSCAFGFGHCTSNPNDGCETSFSRPETCGSCGVRCTDQMSCVVQGSRYTCFPPSCSPPTPDLCGNSCVDVQTDVAHCGTCNHFCSFDNAAAKCANGKCVVDFCLIEGTADCNDLPGCETTLGTRDNCMSCGDKACTGINTVLTCNVGSSCETPACAPGYANCDSTAGCEVAFASATPPCVPRYVGTTVEGTRTAGQLAAGLAADGAYVIGGSFDTVVDFDPSAAMDVRTPTPGSTDAFITKFNADGSYGWTSTLVGAAVDSGSSATSAATVLTVAVQQDGAIVAAGWYQGAVDFDPGPQSDIHVTVEPSAQEPFVIKLSATGALVWARTFVVFNSTWNIASALAVDESAGVYIGGGFQGTLDFDPGPGADIRTAPGQAGFVVKLDGSGNYLWARTSAGSACSDSVSALAVARDGVVWAGGSGTCGFDPVAPGNIPGAMLGGFNTVSGSVRASYFFGSSGEVINGVAIAPDGSLYAVGPFSGPCDFDPGVGVVERRPLGPTPSGFILNLGPDGAFRWVQTITEGAFNAVAVMNDGSIVAVGNGQTGVWNGMLVLRWKGDHAPASSFVAGSVGTFPSIVAAGATGFIVAGINDVSGDFDPGAGTDIVIGGVSFVSRYTF